MANMSKGTSIRHNAAIPCASWCYGVMDGWWVTDGMMSNTIMACGSPAVGTCSPTTGLFSLGRGTASVRWMLNNAIRHLALIRHFATSWYSGRNIESDGLLPIPANAYVWRVLFFIYSPSPLPLSSPPPSISVLGMTGSPDPVNRWGMWMGRTSAGGRCHRRWFFLLLRLMLYHRVADVSWCCRWQTGHKRDIKENIFYFFSL